MANEGIRLVERSAMPKERKILVADDDRITREMLGAILRKAGHEVVFAEDGKAALEAAANEKPDLVLIDGLMPKMHGFLACKAIKELENPPKVVLLTGVYTKPSYKWEAKEAFGADDLLKKPATPDALLACIEKHVPFDTRCEAVSESERIIEPAPAA
jgi:CheY-like chemotaxis protein